MLSTPRTDPGVPNSGTGLLPRVFDGETLVRPRMKDVRFREPGVSDPGDPLPCHTVFLAAPPKRAPPEIGDVIAECTECPRVRGYGVIREVVGPELFVLSRRPNYAVEGVAISKLSKATRTRA